MKIDKLIDQVQKDRLTTEKMLIRYNNNIKSVTKIEMIQINFRNQISILESQEMILLKLREL